MFSGSSAAATSSSSSAKVTGTKLGEVGPSSMTRELAFSSGNPKIEETGGVMHLFRDDAASSASSLPVERKPLVCFLGVPNRMTYADFCQFCGSFIQHMLDMRVVRINDMNDRYSVLIKFDGQDPTDDFYKHFNGKKFSSLEVESCNVLFLIDVLYAGSIGHEHGSVLNSLEQTTCPVCLEVLDQDNGGILTTICNHSFHCSCISLWTDSSCPVCRYCQQEPEKSICFICQTSENLWMCVVCGFVGCGRYKEGHSITHWKETEHCYSLEVETQRVWDYVGDNYVHRLIQSKTDGKLVELNARCPHTESGCVTCDCTEEDPAYEEAILKSKVEVIWNDLDQLLVTRLEKQKLYYESLLQEVNAETEREISVAVQRAASLKFEKLQVKLDKYVEEKKFQDEIRVNLLMNEEIWQRKIGEAEESIKKSVLLKDEKIADLEAELASLLMSLESRESVEQLSISDETKEEDPSNPHLQRAAEGDCQDQKM